MSVHTPDSVGARPSDRALSPSATAPVVAALTGFDPSRGDLKVWWCPQMPMQAFEADVRNLAEASLLLDVLGDYDRFQFENNVKGDYCNAGGLLEYDPDVADWFDWSCPDTGDDFDAVRDDPERLALAIEARSDATGTGAAGRPNSVAHTSLVEALEYVRANLGDPVPIGKRHVARVVDAALAAAKGDAL